MPTFFFLTVLSKMLCNSCYLCDVGQRVMGSLWWWMFCCFLTFQMTCNWYACMRSGSSAACFIEAHIFTVYSLIICITSGIFGRSHCSMFDIRLCWFAYQCACIGYVNVIGIKCECAKIDTILNSLFTFFFFRMLHSKRFSLHSFVSNRLDCVRGSCP